MVNEVFDDNQRQFHRLNRENMFQIDDQDWMNMTKNDDAKHKNNKEIDRIDQPMDIEPLSDMFAFVRVHFHWHLIFVYYMDTQVLYW